MGAISQVLKVSDIRKYHNLHILSLSSDISIVWCKIRVWKSIGYVLLELFSFPFSYYQLFT
jgi:hypothetical protein